MSREIILNNIKKSLTTCPKVDLPQWSSPSNTISPLEQFCEMAKSVGARIIDSHQLDDSLQKYNGSIFSDIHQKYNNVDNQFLQDTPQDLEVLITQAEFGVAENGALYVSEPTNFPRSTLFLCQHLYLLFPTDQLLPDMHSVYAKIQNLPSYGVFISGPSKTADIEQCLVLGAHGAISLTIVFIEKETA